MSTEAFVAFSSSDKIVADTIVSACQAVRQAGRSLVPWNRNDPSGHPIGTSVHAWVSDADEFVADVSEPNHNVTYEIGLALGMRKPVRLIRAGNKDRKLLETIGLLHNVGHDDYHGRDMLSQILRQPAPVAPWPKRKRNREQPVYFLRVTVLEDFLRRVASNIKKTLRLKFRSFDPGEIDRLTATEAYEQVSQSFGVIAVWDNSEGPDAFRQNQRCSFAVGVARGADIPLLLFAHRDDRLPLDLDEIAIRWSRVSDVDTKMQAFRDDVYDAQESHIEPPTDSARFLDQVHCGDPAAENEAVQLGTYFLKTEQFRLTQTGDLNIILGRKGSGKTAVFLQVRDRTRVDKSNIVVDLQPEGYQLLKLKEFIVAQLSYGTRREFLASFWEYIVWLEIAYKLLEKDQKAVQYDSRLLVAYDRLQEEYSRRVEGTGDFAERLANLTDRIVGRYQAECGAVDANLSSSSRILEIVYGSEIRSMRAEVLDYLGRKGSVFFLFDNLDRFWVPPSFSETDAAIVSGLIESLADVRKRFRRAGIDFYWAIFLRSDVFEFVVKGMSDYGKLAVASVEWNDRELLFALFKNRIVRGLESPVSNWEEIWEAVSVQTVKGRPTTDFLLDSSLMRPRYLIRLFETARRRAITLGRQRIEEVDYENAAAELGWQVLEDFDRELSDVVPDVELLIFDLVQIGPEMSMRRLKAAIAQRVTDSSVIETVIDVLIWSGCIGIKRPSGVMYISDCGFKRPYIRSLVNDPDAAVLVFHPTLGTVISEGR